MIELQLLREEVAGCQRCPELVQNRTQTVFADGNPLAPLMIVGEAPGGNEDVQGVPFVGQAGQLLDNILAACGWTRNDVYIANTIRCRPPQNRQPTEEEVGNCKGYLDRQIDMVKPKYLLLLGSTASKALLGMYINQARGVWHTYRGIDVICTYHPSYLFHNPQDKAKVGQDLSVLLTKMRG